MTSAHAVELARKAFLSEVAIPATTPVPKGLSEVVRVMPGMDPSGIGEAVCCIGAFDGVHRGHRFLFSQMLADARARGVSSAIVTFDPDPDELFKPVAAQRKILSNEDRVQFLRRFGATHVVVIPFTRELSTHTAASFMDDVIASAMRPVAVHVGSDFRLGFGNEGSVSSLAELGSARGYEVHGHELRYAGDEPVRATRIRDLLQAGAIDDANDLLCRPHFVRGTVGRGRHQGTEFGFPTANVRVTEPYVMPAEGVYAGFVDVHGVAYPAAINVGAPRSFASDDAGRFLEANLIGYEGDLYDQAVRVAFTRRLRPQRKFETLEELIAVVERNIAWVRDNLGAEGIAL